MPSRLQKVIPAIKYNDLKVDMKTDNTTLLSRLFARKKEDIPNNKVNNLLNRAVKHNSFYCVRKILHSYSGKLSLFPKTFKRIVNNQAFYNFVLLYNEELITFSNEQVQMLLESNNVQFIRDIIELIELPLTEDHLVYTINNELKEVFLMLLFSNRITFGSKTIIAAYNQFVEKKNKLLHLSALETLQNIMESETFGSSYDPVTLSLNYTAKIEQSTTLTRTDLNECSFYLDNLENKINKN